MILRTTIGAFVLSQGVYDAVEALRDDRTFLRSEIHTFEGGLAAAVEYLGENKTPPVLLVESHAEGEALFDELEQLAGVCAPNTRLILVGIQNDIHLFKDLIQQGVSQYFVTDVTSEELTGSIQEMFLEAGDENLGRIIAVTGARGGVGASIIAHNLASELANTYGEEVILVDTDIPFGTAALNLAVTPRHTIVDAITQTKRLDEVLMERFVERVGSQKSKLSLLASPSSLTSGIEMNHDSFEKVLGFLKRMAGFVVLDVPNEWSGWVVDLLTDADEVVVVTKADLANLQAAKNIMEQVSPNRGVNAPTRLVWNMVGEAKKSELTPSDFKDVTGFEPSVQIPSEPQTFGDAVNNAEMIAKSAPKSKVAEALVELAQLVSGRLPPVKEKLGFLEKLGLGKKKTAEPEQAE